MSMLHVLETSWTEHILMQPIRSNMFPHSAMPSTRPKGADIMTKSLNMALGAAAGLTGGAAAGIAAAKSSTAAENGSTAMAPPTMVRLITSDSKSHESLQLAGVVH